jgi:hypothetical protein
MVPRSPKLGTGSNMGQFSVEISALPGSILNGNQQRVKVFIGIASTAHAKQI